MLEEKQTLKIKQLNDKLQDLPKGYISKKEINGNIYYYHQWSENGKKKSKYLNNEELENLTKAIELRNKIKEDIKLFKRLPINTENSHYKSFYLMHKSNKVVEIIINDETGKIERIEDVFFIEDLPIGTYRKNSIDIEKLREWWMDRSIPANRSGIRNILTELKIDSPHELLTKSYGVNLSDQYWICPKGSTLIWDDINFFKNDFSEDIGRLLFGEPRTNNTNYISPDITTDGNLKKRWTIENGKRVLLKAGSGAYRQQVFNEIIAAKIMQLLNIPHVDYWVEWHHNEPYSACANFINENIELVPAWRILQVKNKPNHVSFYEHFINCTTELGISDVEDFLNKMIVVDYIIANEDRHYNNFGAIRDANTLEWLGMAPIYDSGTALGYNRIDNQIANWSRIECKPFKKMHQDQLKLVSSFEGIDLDNLDNIDVEIRNLFKDEKRIEYLEDTRLECIINFIKSNINSLKEYIRKGNRVEDNIEQDIKKNVATSY